MEKKLDAIESKLDKVSEDIGEIKETLVRNTISLEIHEKRTTASEARIEQVEKQVLAAASVIKFLLAGIGVAGAIFKILEYFKI